LAFLWPRLSTLGAPIRSSILHGKGRAPDCEEFRDFVNGLAFFCRLPLAANEVTSDRLR
jgi:hypothetical protein